MNINRIRGGVASSLIGLFLAAFVTQSCLYSSYTTSRPRQPIPQQGFTYAIQNRSVVFYVSAGEVTRLALLFWTFSIAIGLFVLVIPKTQVLRKITFTNEQKIILPASIITDGAFFVLGGPLIVDLLVSRGIIIQLP